MHSNQHRVFDRIVWSLAVAFGCVAAGSVAHGAGPAQADMAQWQSECGSCHLAYPPRLLPADGWKAVMGSLDKHFGVDASVDAGTDAAIRRYLLSRAPASVRGGAAADPRRITQAGWFMREHDEVPAAAWRHPGVGSPANCAACHRDAAQGSFDEESVRIPGRSTP